MTDNESNTETDAQTTNRASLADKVLDNVTDIIALLVIGAILLYFGEPSTETLAAIASIALGKRYLKAGK